ncbi:MAG: glycosyltransferase [Rubripirellula sp.]
MRAILSAPGSRGDVNPMIAIGRRLRSLGHEVVISLAEPYADVARDADLQVEAVISREEFSQALGNPNVWKPVQGPLQVFRTIVHDYLGRHQAVIERHHVPGQTILVAHPLDLASRIFRDAHPEIGLATVHLQPVILRTFDSPPRLSPWWFEVSRPAWALRTAYWFADHVAIDPVIRGPVNRMRKDYGLPSIRRPLNQWWHSPDKVLAMYPDWFAPATRGFLTSLVHCGFPLQDHTEDEFRPPDDRPIVFTSGTAHQHCRRFFELAVESCLKLNRPGLLLSTFAENFPSDLPPTVRPVSYVSFSQLLPQCAAIVHHGGVGTTSQAIAAGIPQVIRPHAFDQFDNAQRVERLGCGRWLRRDRELIDVLKQLLENPPAENVEKREALSRELVSHDSIGFATDHIESLFLEKSST